MITFTTVPILVALMMGLMLTTGFHVVYKANANGLGIVEIAPWRQRLSDATARVTTSWSAWIASCVRTRQQLIAASLALALCLAYPSVDAFAGAAMIGVAGTLNVDAIERDLLKKTGEAAALFEKTARECQAFEEKDKDGKVIATGRPMTEDERKAIQKHIDEGNALKARIAQAKGDANLSAEIEQLTAGMTAPQRSASGAVIRQPKSLGQQFIESATGQFFAKKLHHGSRNWQTPVAELFDMHAATLTTDAASGGDLIVSDFRPGILPLLFKRLTVRDLLAPGSTDSNNISYMKETTFTNAAAAVTEGAAKPESTLIFDLVNDLVQVIAHWLPVTEQMLEDVKQIRAYIDARLRLGVDLTEEDQLLNGDGTPPNISGILDRVGLTAAQARGADTNADAIFKEMMKIFNAAFIMPDGHVINPTNWQTIQLGKDANGQYYGSGPFAGPQPATLWGLPVAVSPSIAAGTALSGSFKSSAQIFDHGGMRVDVSNSHSDFFIKNLVAIRAERRLALAVYRPAAFGTSTGLN